MWQSGDDIFYVMFEKVRHAIWLTLSTLIASLNGDEKSGRA